MRGKRRLLMVAVLTLGGMLLLGSFEVFAAPPEGTLKQAIHWSLSADYLDPATCSNSKSAFLVLYLFHDTLVKAMPGGYYTPSLAESWSVSTDARVYEFRLRKGVKFHNGDPLTAEDVVFSFQRYKSAHAKFIHDRIEKMEAVNPYLFRLRFKEAFPDFFEYLLPGSTTLGWIVPKKYLEKVGEAGFKKHPIGCGPYKFVEFETGVKVVGEAYEDYWRKVPSVKRLEFLIIPEPATRLAMVRRGEVDIATLLQGVFYESVKKDPQLRLLTPLSSTIWIVQMTNQWDPKSPWSDVRVRRAASLAIDRQTLADVHMPGCVPVGTIGSDDDPSVLNIPVDPYDPEKAKKLLAEAGYPSGFQGGPFYPYEGGYWPYGEQVANYWKAIGITVDSRLLDRPALLAQHRSKKMKGGTFIEPSMPPTMGMRLSYLFTDTSYGNYPEIQGLWDQYQKAIDPKTRKDLIGGVQKLIHEKVMYLPLTMTNSPAALGPRVKGDPFKIQPLIWFTCPFEDLELVR
jgi:peptide/nickel transport system substrate-binding protein